MNPRHALRDFRWWYRTTFKRWHEGPDYAECPDCGGRVYHQWRTVVEYRCHDCDWHEYGTTDFEFYEDQRPEQTALEVYKTYSKLVADHSPGTNDPEAFVEWATNGGLETVGEDLRHEYDDETLREAAREFDRVRSDG